MVLNERGEASDPTTAEILEQRAALAGELERMQGYVGKPYVQQIVTGSVEAITSEIAKLDEIIAGGGTEIPAASRHWF